MSDIPNTDTKWIAIYAIAWEIVKKAYEPDDETFYHLKSDEKIKVQANAVIKTYNAIWNNDPIED